MRRDLARLIAWTPRSRLISEAAAAPGCSDRSVFRQGKVRLQTGRLAGSEGDLCRGRIRRAVIPGGHHGMMDESELVLEIETVAPDDNRGRRLWRVGEQSRHARVVLTVGQRRQTRLR